MSSHVLEVNELNGAKFSFNDKQELQVFPKGEYRVPKALLTEIFVSHQSLPISFHEITPNAANTMAAMVPSIQLENILAIKQVRHKVGIINAQLLASMVNNLREFRWIHMMEVDNFSVVPGYATPEGFPMTVLDNATGILAEEFPFEMLKVPGRMLPEVYVPGWDLPTIPGSDDLWALCLSTIEHVSGRKGLFSNTLTEEENGLLMSAILGVENSSSKSEIERGESPLGLDVQTRDGMNFVIDMKGHLDELISDKVLLKLIKDLLKGTVEAIEVKYGTWKPHVNNHLVVQNEFPLREDFQLYLIPSRVHESFKNDPRYSGIPLSAIEETFESLVEEIVPVSSTDSEIVNVLRGVTDKMHIDSFIGRLLSQEEYDSYTLKRGNYLDREKKQREFFMKN